LYYEKAKQFCRGGIPTNYCNGETYTMDEFCQSGTVKILCGGKEFPAGQFCIGTTINALCNNVAYAVETQGCCNATVYDLETLACNWDVIYSRCGTYTYVPTEKFCHNEKTYSLCGGLSYDVQTQACCDATVYDLETQGRTQVCVSGKVRSICGDKKNNLTYLPSSQFCRDGKVGPLCNKDYDFSTQWCNDGNVQDIVDLKDARDGKTYRTIGITQGHYSQLWMAENLAYKAGATACQDPYGGYYTWKQAMVACPKGWHLPSVDEWSALPDREALSASALLGGFRDSDGTFYDVGDDGSWWTSSEKASSYYSQGEAYCREGLGFSGVISRLKDGGRSVRCIQD
jgi:hypothetical protein